MIYAEETNERVGDGKPIYVSRFRWLAERKARRHRAYIVFPSYRLEVVRQGRHWAVVAMQNRAISHA